METILYHNFTIKQLQSILQIPKAKATKLLIDPHQRISLKDLAKLQPQFKSQPITPELPEIIKIDQDTVKLKYKRRQSTLYPYEKDALADYIYLAELHKTRENNPAYTYPMTVKDIYLSKLYFRRLSKLLQEDYDALKNYLCPLLSQGNGGDPADLQEIPNERETYCGSD